MVIQKGCETNGIILLSGVYNRKKQRGKKCETSMWLIKNAIIIDKAPVVVL